MGEVDSMSRVLVSVLNQHMEKVDFQNTLLLTIEGRDVCQRQIIGAKEEKEFVEYFLEIQTPVCVRFELRCCELPQ